MASVLEDPSKTVVGIYRGRPRGETTLRESDQEILDVIERAHPSFEADFRGFVVLAPMSDAMALVCVTMRDGGEWGEMQPFTLRSNPFAIVALPPSTALQQMSRNLHTEQQAIQPAESSLAVQPTEDRMAEPREAERPAAEHRTPEAPTEAVYRWTFRGARIWFVAAAGLAAVILAVAGGYRFARVKQTASAPVVQAEKTEASRVHLGFSATREGPVWKLSWDRAAMDELNPIGAVLSIEDGGYLQQLPLAPADLASGILFYTPQSNDLSFDLRIDRGGAHVEEQVRVLAPTRAPFDRAQQQSFPPKAPVQPPANVQQQPPAAVVASTTGSTAGSTAGSTTAPAPAPSAPPRKFVLPPNPGSAASVSENPVPQAPVVALAVPIAPNLGRTNPDLGALPAPVARPEPAPSAPAVPNTNPVASSATAPKPNPGAAAPAPPNYLGPRPTRQVSPPAPAILPPGVSQVEVMVEIDVHGKVTKATPVGWTPANAALMIGATRAASSWVFAPAH